MKLGHFPIVEAMVSTRNHLVGQRDEGKFGIDINGRRQDIELVNQVRPAIIAVLDSRIADLDEQLREHGVEID